MPGPDESMVFKYFAQTLPMTDPAWAAGASWCSWRADFPLYLTGGSGELHCCGRQHRPAWATEVRCLYIHYGWDSPGKDAEGWLFQPADLSAATMRGHQAPTLPRISWVWFQRCWLHSWSMHRDISCSRYPAFWATAVLECEGSHSSSHRVGRVLQRHPLERQRTLENIESSGKAII